MKLAVAVLAAGKGTRLKSKRPKVLHTVGGKPLLEHVLAAASAVAPPEDTYVVIGHQAEAVRAAVAGRGVYFVEQTEQKGTGHAIQQALPALEGYDALLVLSGDVPLLKPETIRHLITFHQEHGAAMTVLSARVNAPTGYGRIVRRAPAAPELAVIVEQKDLAPGQERIHEINSGIYAFSLPELRAHIGGLTADNAGGELYLTDMARLLNQAEAPVFALETSSAGEVLGANTIAEMMALDSELRRAATARHMAAGVTIFQPETVVIDADVEIGPDTVLEPFTQLLGATRVGPGCRIRSYSVLEDVELGEGVLVRQGCILSGSRIAAGALLGPYTHIRPESEVGAGAHVGNFVELKKTRMAAGAKANHLAYLGDTTIGEGANIGAGTIVCNYDGVRKYPTMIGEGAFIGSDSVLVAPVTIGAGAYVAAASCITESVPEGALALGRARQVVKEGWAAKKRTEAGSAGG